VPASREYQNRFSVTTNGAGRTARSAEDPFDIRGDERRRERAERLRIFKREILIESSKRHVLLEFERNSVRGVLEKCCSPGRAEPSTPRRPPNR